MITVDPVADLFLPFLAGILIPLVTAWIKESRLPDQLETLLNIALSALAATIPVVAFDGSWRDYGLAVLVTWLGTMRSHYTQLPTKLWSRDPYGRHAAVDDPSPIDYHSVQ